MKLGLKIDVRTCRGVREGVPRLMDILTRHHAPATFFFTLGPDHLLGRPWLPGREIGRRCRNELRAVRAAGFEVGIHSYDQVRWARCTRSADQAWTRHQMQLAQECFLKIFDEPAQSHAAAAWQMNRHAYRLTQRMGFRYCSDTRGSCPFLPVYHAEIMACPQLPTTLPTLGELAGNANIARDDLAERMLRLSTTPAPGGHVYTARAEVEGMALAPVFDALLAGWRAQGYVPMALENYMIDIDPARLPRHSVLDGDMPGRHGPAALQGEEFLA